MYGTVVSRYRLIPAWRAERPSLFRGRGGRVMYYRVAIQVDASPAWQWKSTTLSSLNAVFQFLRRFHDLPQERLRVFSSSEGDPGEQLATENNGLGSHSVTAAQFMQERGICSLQRPS